MSQNVQETSRKVRLHRRRELYRQRVARETTEQKESRQARRRERYAACRAELRQIEFGDQKEERLQEDEKFMLLSLMTREKRGYQGDEKFMLLTLMTGEKRG